MAIQNDWSDRHVALRRRMILLALLTFAFARVRIADLDLAFVGTLSGTAVTGAELSFAFAVMFAYGLIEFTARTQAELRNISAYSAKLQRTLHRIDELRNRTAALFRSFEGALVSKRLDVWNEALKAGGTSSLAADRRLFETLHSKLDRLQHSAERIRHAVAGREAAGEAAVHEFDREKLQAGKEAAEILQLLDKVGDLGRGFEERRQSFDAAIVESRTVMEDARSFFTDKAGRGAEDLNGKLAIAVANIKDIQRALRLGNRSHRVDRYLFGVHLPRAIGVLLVLLSIDQVVGGAVRLAGRAWTVAAALLG